MTPEPTRSGRRHGRGFTLIEMVTSLIILGVLLLACGSIVFMATQATGDSATRTATQFLAADAASQMADDLNVATNFTQRTPKSVTFTVPDRLNTGAPQVVSYQWSGTPGDPLIRQFNGGLSTSVLDGVQGLAMTYDTRVTGPAPAPADQVIYSHNTVVGTAKDYALDDKNWASQYFMPSLPLGTSSYTITKIRLCLKSNGGQDGIVSVSVRLPDGSLRPTSTTLGQTTVYEAAFSNGYEWVDVPITGLSGLSPYQGLCIVLTNSAGTKNMGSIQIDQSILNILSTAAWSQTTNAGSSWSTGVSTTVARFYVFGTVP